MLWEIINGLQYLHVNIAGFDATKLCDMCKPGSVPRLLSLTAEQHLHIKAWITHFRLL